MIFVITWFIIGFIGGILCSLVDFFINETGYLEVKMAVILSFAGPFLILWFFIYQSKSKKQKMNCLFRQY